MGCFSEFWVRFRATVAKLVNEIKMDIFSVEETVFTLIMQGVTRRLKRGVVEKDPTGDLQKDRSPGGCFFPPLSVDVGNTLHYLCKYGLPDAKSVHFELVWKFSNGGPKRIQNSLK